MTYIVACGVKLYSLTACLQEECTCITIVKMVERKVIKIKASETIARERGLHYKYDSMRRVLMNSR